MKKLIRISIIISIAALVVSTNVFGEILKEPDKPNTAKTFDPGKENNIDEIASLSTEEAFEKLRNEEFLSNPDLAYKAIFKAYRKRVPEILDFVQLYLMLPLREVVSSGDETWARSFLLSKRIFETFPEQAAPLLRALYNSGDEVTRGNAIWAAGKVAGGEQTKRLLIEALDDNAYFETPAPETMGEPLRVCDMAYNQLVLRYSIKNVYRTIGPGNTIDVRDQLIDMLKGKMK